MFSREKCFYFLVMIGCGVFDEVSTLRCYECTESEPNACGTQFDKKSVRITDCQTSIYTVDDNAALDKMYACLYIKETDVLLKNSTYTRRCSIKNSADTCENIVAKNQMTSRNLRTTCVQCEKDLCNSSSLLSRNIIMIFVTLSFVVLRFL